MCIRDSHLHRADGDARRLDALAGQQCYAQRVGLADAGGIVRAAAVHHFHVRLGGHVDDELAARADYPPGVSETDALGIELLPSQRVKPPRIAISPVQMECRLDQAVTLGRGVNTLYIGEVVAFHIHRDLYDGSRIDSVKMRPVARLGGPYYAGLGEIFHRPMLQRPPGGEGWGGEPENHAADKPGA